MFRRKYVKPESQATAEHKWHKLTFNPNTKSLPDFLEELNDCAERAFADNAQHMIDSLLCQSTMPPHLKRSLNLAYLENGRYDQIGAHLKKKLQLSGLENDEELTIPTRTAVPPNENQQNTEQTKVTCHYCKKPGHVIRDCRRSMRKEQEQRNDPPNQNIKTFDIQIISTLSSLSTDKPPSRKVLERSQRSKQTQAVQTRISPRKSK